MFRNLKQQIAVTLNVLLGLQLMVLGFGVNVSSASAATTNYQNPDQVYTNNGWYHPSSVKTSNNDFAIADSGNDVATFGNFNFNVPANATVTGLEVKIEGFRTLDRQIDISLSGDTGSTFGPVKKTNLPRIIDGEGTRYFGSASDLWGKEWTPENLKNTNFRVKLDATTGFILSQVFIDQLMVKVSFDEAPVITPMPDMTVEATSKDGAIVEFASEVFDAEDDDLIADCQALSGTTFPIGTTTVTCNAIDSVGNVAEAVVFDVVVSDTKAPEVQVEDMTVYTSNTEGKNVDTFLVTATDEVDENVEVTCDIEEGYLFPVGNTIVTCDAIDEVGNRAVTKTFIVTVVYDADPTLEVLVQPKTITDVEKPVEIYFTASEEMKLSEIVFLKDGVPVVIDFGAITISDEDIFTTVKKVTISGGWFEKGEYELVMKYRAFDANDKKDQPQLLTQIIKVDTVAPKALSTLSAVVNENGQVLVTWTNPNTTNDFKTISIYRDGAFLTTLPADVTSFLDTNVEKGKTYYYEIVLTDDAGNTTVTPRVSVSTPEPVVAAIASDTVVLTPKKAETKPVEQEVKAETTENKVEENKEEDNKLPLWGLIILLVLAGVGGYLYYSKDGKEISKPIAQKTSAAAKPKKAAPKKKSKK